MTFCVDASLVLRWMLPEDGRGQAEAWFEQYGDDQLIGPHFLPIEVMSVLRRACRQGVITSEEALEDLALLNKLGLRLVGGSALLERALVLAEELDQPTIYDSIYLAVAEAEGCELWTVDERFAKAAARHSRLRLLGRD